MTEQELRAALARSLSAEMPADTRMAVLHEIHKIRERKNLIVKSKLSVAIILAIVLTLLSGVALAVTLSRAYFEDVAVLQFESGYSPYCPPDCQLHCHFDRFPQVSDPVNRQPFGNFQFFRAASGDDDLLKAKSGHFAQPLI